jgi:6-phosphogluconolactonase
MPAVSHDCRVSPDKATAAKAAAEHILQSLAAARSERPLATIAVSGGSTPKLMFEAMAAAEFDWSRVHLFWVDERCVPPDHPDSNFGMTTRAWIDRVALPPEQLHRIEGELEPGQAAADYQAGIRRFFELEGDGLPRFDVVHLGMGPDSHTASLFPGEELINDRRGIASSVYVASKQSYRVTLLPGVLLNAAETVFLVSGSDKAEPLRNVFQEPLDASPRPVQLFARESANVRWFLDEAAGGYLR